jgi:hypothetical protein
VAAWLGGAACAPASSSRVEPRRDPLPSSGDASASSVDGGALPEAGLDASLPLEEGAPEAGPSSAPLGSGRAAFPRGVRSVAVAGSSVWAVLTDGALYVRGKSALFDPSAKSRAPVEHTDFSRVEGLPPLSDVAVGEGHVCGVTLEGTVVCWGSNFGGALARSTNVNAQTRLPVEVVAGPSGVISVHTRRSFVGVVTRSGEVFTWGLRWDTYRQTAKPEKVPFPRPVRTLDLGASRGCAILDDGRGYCFGLVHGRIWDYGRALDHQDRSESPGWELQGVRDLDAISAGSDHGCAVSKGEVFCWGAGGARSARKREVHRGRHAAPTRRCDVLLLRAEAHESTRYFGCSRGPCRGLAYVRAAGDRRRRVFRREPRRRSRRGGSQAARGTCRGARERRRRASALRAVPRAKRRRAPVPRQRQVHEPRLSLACASAVADDRDP